MFKLISSLSIFVLLLLSKTSVVRADLAGDQPARLQDLEEVFGNIAAFLLPTAGILFFLMFVAGGFKYLTSAGDLNSVAAAHKTLTYAIMGLIVVALAYILLLVINFLTGNTDILNFTIYRG